MIPSRCSSVFAEHGHLRSAICSSFELAIEITLKIMLPVLFRLTSASMEGGHERGDLGHELLVSKPSCTSAHLDADVRHFGVRGSRSCPGAS